MTNERSTEFDAIVVGSGPGGGTVARELSKRGRRVLILEAGSDAPVNDSLRSQTGAMRMDFMGRAVPIVRGITLGGTSMLYYGCAFEPPLEMFRAHGIDLAREVEEIRKELPVGPLPDRAIGPRARMIMESARGLGYDWKKLDKFVFGEKCDDGVPHEAKWNARLFVREAEQNGAVVRTRARVTKVLVDRGAAVGVEYRHSGEPRSAHAPRIIVAAGGVGSAVLLRASGLRRAGEGFFCDPLVFVNGSLPGPIAGREPPMTAGIHLPDDGYMMTDLAHPTLLYRVLAAQVLRFDRLLAHPRTLSIMVKSRDDIDGRITENGRVRRVFTREDVGRMKHGYGRAKEILRNAGAKRIFRTWYLAAHPGGTVRVGDVLDSDLRTEYEGLYVCDCSVIPEPWGLPPTFTLIALAKRLARHLADDV